ncbi:hypothetical protein CDL15_Pgr026329 [Punica granatum]|uniref:Uncharacterized protein n=1 Tax=Punica granatum TaxID=22663 RepID=A0A218XQH4_PUNGR|nr:hypothetical protein CDL15_Pgr026329 [Punica granatum]
MADKVIYNHPNAEEQEVGAIQTLEQRIERIERTLEQRFEQRLDRRFEELRTMLGDMIQLEDPSHGHEEKSQDDKVGQEGELWDKHVPARASTKAQAKRIQQAMQGLLLHVHGGVVKLLGGLHVELEVTTVHILEIYLEDDPSSKG